MHAELLQVKDKLNTVKIVKSDLQGKEDLTSLLQNGVASIFFFFTSYEVGKEKATSNKFKIFFVQFSYSFFYHGVQTHWQSHT